VIALDTKTGNVLWDISAVDYTKGYSFTLAPLVIKNLVLVGVSGGEYGIRGFIDAYDVNTGERKWRFYTIPAPGEPGNESWEGQFQFTKHDEHDYDATQIPVMVDDNGKKLILQANRNGFFYVIDRTNGKLIRADSYAKVSWAKEKDANGRPVPAQEGLPTLEG